MIDSVFGENRRALDAKKKSVMSLSEWMYRSAARELIAKIGYENTPDDVREYYSSLFGGEVFSDEFALFCREYSHECAGKIHPFPSYDEPVSYDLQEGGDVQPRIAYVRNQYSDKVYMIFASQTDVSGANYCTSFREACEDVYYLRSRYAILPIYSSTDGYLSPFRRLMIKYDLKIAYTAECDTDDDTVTRFALLRKGLPHFDGDGKRRVLLSVTPSAENKFGGIISSLSSLGAEVAAVSTQSAEYSAAGSCFDIVLTADADTYAALYLFLEGTHIRYNIVGNYVSL